MFGNWPENSEDGQEEVLLMLIVAAFLAIVIIIVLAATTPSEKTPDPDEWCLASSPLEGVGVVVLGKESRIHLNKAPEPDVEEIEFWFFVRSICETETFGSEQIPDAILVSPGLYVSTEIGDSIRIDLGDPLEFPGVDEFPKFKAVREEGSKDGYPGEVIAKIWDPHRQDGEYTVLIQDQKSGEIGLWSFSKTSSADVAHYRLLEEGSDISYIVLKDE